MYTKRVPFSKFHKFVSFFSIALGLLISANVHAYVQEKEQKLANGERPNFVVVLADDLGWGDTATYGNELIRTPNRRFARE